MQRLRFESHLSNFPLESTEYTVLNTHQSKGGNKIIVFIPTKNEHQLLQKSQFCFNANLKTLDTIGNCQRPVFSLGVSQYMHKIINL